MRFSIFYGAAANELEALTSIAAVDASAYSLAEPSAPTVDAGDAEHLRLRIPSTGPRELRTGCRRRHARHRAGQRGDRERSRQRQRPEPRPADRNDVHTRRTRACRLRARRRLRLLSGRRIRRHDSFQYTISDGHGGVDTATVHVTVGSGPTVVQLAATALLRRVCCSRGRVRLATRMRTPGLRRSTTATGRCVPLSFPPDKSFQLSHTYLDNGSYTVTVCVGDGHTSGSDTFLGDGHQCGAVRRRRPGRDYRRRRHLLMRRLVRRPRHLDSWTATVNYGDGSVTSR